MGPSTPRTHPTSSRRARLAAAPLLLAAALPAWPGMVAAQGAAQPAPPADRLVRLPLAAPPPLPPLPEPAAESTRPLDASPSPAAASPAAELAAVPEPAVQELVVAAGTACRAALAQRFRTTPDQVEAWLVPALAIAIEGGERSLASLRQEGLAFGWMVRGRPDPLPIGLCRTDGRPVVVAIEEQKD